MENPWGTGVPPVDAQRSAPPSTPAISSTESPSEQPVDPASGSSGVPPASSECGQDARAPGDLTPDLFRGVAGGDSAIVAGLLDRGADANAPLPEVVPDDLAALMEENGLAYFLRAERGFTPLMLAASLGHLDVAKLLLKRGAKRGAGTKRHRTSALWLAGHFGQVPLMQLLLEADPGAERIKICISLADQKAVLWKDGQVARTMPVSTGRKRMPTPKGRYVITDKYRDWKSTLYPARMPYFLRLSCKDFGMHAGVLPGYPASHGCIRLPASDAKALFAEVPVGTLVEIE